MIRSNCRLSHVSVPYLDRRYTEKQPCIRRQPHVNNPQNFRGSLISSIRLPACFLLYVHPSFISPHSPSHPPHTLKRKENGRANHHCGATRVQMLSPSSRGKEGNRSSVIIVICFCVCVRKHTMPYQPFLLQHPLVIYSVPTSDLVSLYLELRYKSTRTEDHPSITCSRLKLKRPPNARAA